MTKENFYVGESLVAFEASMQALMETDFEILKANVQEMTIEARRKAGLKNQRSYFASVNLFPTDFKTISIHINFYRGGMLGIKIPFNGGLHEEEILMGVIKKNIKRTAARIRDLKMPPDNIAIAMR